MLIPFNGQHTHSTSYKDTKMLTQAELKSQFSYNIETGIFTRKRFNKECKTIKDNKYVVIYVNKKLHYAHRLAWLYVYGYLPKFIDHIDSNRSNNILSNLRECTRFQNRQNIKTSTSANKSGYLGVSFNKQKKKYIAELTINNKRYYGGSFLTAEEAHEAYVKLKRKLHEFCTI